MLDRLKLTKNAQFYASINIIDDDSIRSIIDEAVSNRVDNSNFVIEEFRLPRTINLSNSQLDFKYSLYVFPTIRPVYFLDVGINDTIYAYILIIEIGSYIAVLKKSCANITDSIESYFNQLSSDQLISTFDDDVVDFQKISLRNMTVSEKALRSRSYEATDLKGILSTHSAGRSIPYFLKVRDGVKLKSISTHTGRIFESSERASLDVIAAWSNEQLTLIQNPITNKTFLESFAQLVNLEDVLRVTEPSSILIENSALLDKLNELQTPIFYTTKKGKKIELSKTKTNFLLSKLENVYEIDTDLKILGHESSSKLRLNTKSISINSKELVKLKLFENGVEITLQKLIVKNMLFSVCFNDPKYIYFMGRCFKDTSGISEIDSILETFVPKQELLNNLSEKGNALANSSKFDALSIFDTVENLHSTDDYIFCDDLGNEWADHITLNKSESCIRFIHSKHGDTSKSASNLHEVVGQAIKNLGNMFFTTESFLKKNRMKLSTLYANTQINRTRKSNQQILDSYLIDLLKEYNLHRMCILCCTFLSKSQITAEFNKIKRAEKVNGNILQLFWIVSSFTHAAKDMNVIPIIYCKP
jgi:hypothetical protein